MNRLHECLKKNSRSYVNCVNQVNESRPVHLGEGTLYSPEGLVSDDQIAWPMYPLDEDNDDDKARLDESIEREEPRYHLTLEPVCQGFKVHEHRFVAPSKDTRGRHFCELCLDKWIKRTNVFSQCKNCDFKLCEQCYDKHVLPHA
jgi:hypothetical protein